MGRFAQRGKGGGRSPGDTSRAECTAGLMPLHHPLAIHSQFPVRACVPGATLRDAALYELRALFDALRAGRARDRSMAAKRLLLPIDPAAAASAKASRRG